MTPKPWHLRRLASGATSVRYHLMPLKPGETLISEHASVTEADAAKVAEDERAREVSQLDLFGGTHG